MQQPIVSTKHGYASAAMTRGDASYPSYTMPHDAFGDVQLKPNRRPLFIGLGLAVVGIIVILAVSLGGKEPEKIVTPPEEEEGSGSAPMQESREVTPPPAPQPAVDDGMVGLIIKSDPPGAEVLVAGTKIGTTPFDKKMKRGMKAELTLRLEGYEDFKSKLDLATTYDKTIKLVKVEVDEPAIEEETTDQTPVNANEDASKSNGSDTTKSTTGDATKSTTGDATKSTTTSKSNTTRSNTTSTKTTKSNTGTSRSNSSTTKSNNTPPKQKCQPPGPNVDPFSGVPICKS
jgi:hypothetical protein